MSLLQYALAKPASRRFRKADVNAFACDCEYNELQMRWLRMFCFTGAIIGTNIFIEHHHFRESRIAADRYMSVDVSNQCFA